MAAFGSKNVHSAMVHFSEETMVKVVLLLQSGNLKTFEMANDVYHF